MSAPRYTNGNRHPSGFRIIRQGICPCCGQPKDIHTSRERRACAAETE